jgi:hypothetical protein
MTAAMRACALVTLLAALGGCQQNGNGGYDGYGVTSGNGEISPVAGALGGAGLGALAGRLIAGKHDNSEAMLGGALIGGLGGLIGSQAYDQHKAQENQARQLSEQESWAQNQAAQQAAANQQAESQSLYDQWGQSQGYAGPVNAPAEVKTAQRMLTVLGLYSGPIDGQDGPQTSVAIAQFQKSRGLPTTGNVTPSLIQMMKVAI